MRTLLLLSFITISFQLSAQKWFTYQEPAIYMKNRVFFRTSKLENMPPFGEKVIDKFNKKGQLIEYELFLNNISQMKIKWEYNSQQQLSKENYFYGEIKGEEAIFTYNSNGKLSSKKRFYTTNQIKTLTTYGYFPKVEETKSYDSSGKLESIEKLTFERNKISRLFEGKDFAGNRENNWKYSFKNRYNSKDQLIWRKNESTGSITEFFYNDKGLLIRMIYSIRVGEYLQKETTLFTYEYY